MLKRPVNSKLLFAPMKTLVEAQISTLSPEVIQKGIMKRWWNDECLIKSLSAKQIDRNWNWNDFAIEWNGIDLESEKVGAITGDGDVQGAMLIQEISYTPMYLSSMAAERLIDAAPVIGESR